MGSIGGLIKSKHGARVRLRQRKGICVSETTVEGNGLISGTLFIIHGCVCWWGSTRV